MDRRSMITGSLGLLGVAGASTLGLRTRPAFATSNMSLGSATIDVVHDGNLVLPMDFLYPNVPSNELLSFLQANNLPTDAAKPDCNLTLLRDGDRTILFDAGSGPFFMDSAGTLTDSLQALDVTPEEITHVVFTHAHPDHLWGVIDDFDDPLFANATHMISSTEMDFWMSDATLDAMPEARKTFAVGARNRLEAIEDVLETFTPGQEILSGIHAVDSKGHTPGHCSFEIRSEGESALVVGDAIAHHLISFEHGAWPSGSDQDAEQGIKTRLMLLDRLAAEKMKIVGYHLPYPGTGYVEKHNGAYRFVAV